MTRDPKRHSAGTPGSVGGQFAPDVHLSADYSLGGPSVIGKAPRRGSSSEDPVSDVTTTTSNGLTVRERIYDNGYSNTRFITNDAGLEQDGPNGEPAVEVWDDYGLMSVTEHYDNGVLNDSINGEPAKTVTFENGRKRIERYRNGKLQDGTNGEPAVVSISDTGRTTEIGRYRNGERNNGPDGEPASQKWYDNGTRSSLGRWENGKLNNGPNDEPAVEFWDEDGVKFLEQRYDGGRLNDGPNGEPAVSTLGASSGKITKTRYRNGERVPSRTEKIIGRLKRRP